VIDDEVAPLESRYVAIGREIMRRLDGEELALPAFELSPEQRTIRGLRRQVESLTFETWVWGGLFFLALVLLLARGGRQS
jgi:hypothetical protein